MFRLLKLIHAYVFKYFSRFCFYLFSVFFSFYSQYTVTACCSVMREKPNKMFTLSCEVAGFVPPRVGSGGAARRCLTIFLFPLIMRAELRSHLPPSAGVCVRVDTELKVFSYFKPKAE